MKLRSVLRSDLSRYLQLDDDRVKTDEVRLIGLLELNFLVAKLKARRGLEWDGSLLELKSETFLVDGLKKTATHDPVHLEDGPANLERLPFTEKGSLVTA